MQKYSNIKPYLDKITPLKTNNIWESYESGTKRISVSSELCESKE